ncbi:MAG: hypothetical protein LBT01_05300 [Spirochaetaceae bacterium]|jgi:hypothetical protein|nr:hypothetical protein [Spirochaetaceae bacterium]
MEKKRNLLGMLAMVLVFGMALVGCDDGSDDDDGGGGGGKDLKYSIQVKNQLTSPSSQQLSVARAVSAEDEVELYILNFEYCEDANNRGLILIANGDRDTGSKHTILNNAGWYSVNANLAVENDVNNGPYSSFQIRISKLRVGGADGTTYDFQGNSGVFFGHPTSIWNGGQSNYPDNFSGITMTDSTVSLKTVLTVDPDIIGEEDSEGYDSQGLATDPYKYIKVAGLVNE